MRRKHNLFASGSFGSMTANERRLGRYIRDGEGHPPAPAPTPIPTPEEMFDAAFAENTAETPVPAAAAAENDASGGAAASDGGSSPADAGDGGAPAQEGAPAKSADASTGGDAAVLAAGDAAAAPEPKAEPKPESAGLNAEDVLNRLAELVKPGEASPPAPTPDAETLPVYSDVEAIQLAEYEKNWPDVAAGEALKRRAEYADIFKFVFSEVAKYTAPLFEAQRAIGNTLHTQELTTLVPDYSASEEEAVSAWISTEPSYLQEGMNKVMKSGTPEEVADLIGRYRAATGTVPAASAPAAPAAPAANSVPAAAPKTELSSAAKQAAESLAPVSGDRSAVPQGEDLGDYDTAFAKYAATPAGT